MKGTEAVIEYWRRCQRRWHSDPEDQFQLRRSVQAMWQSSLIPSEAMMDALRWPGQEFRSKHAFHCGAIDSDGRFLHLGETPQANDQAIVIPEHRVWWLHAAELKDDTIEQRLLDGIKAQVPGLALHGELSSEALSLLRRLPWLRFLDLGGCRLLTHLDFLESLSKLAFLNLERCHAIAAEAWPVLRHLKRLNRLNLSHCAGLSDAGVEALSQLPALFSLDLGWCRGVSDQALSELGRLERLSTLTLKDVQSLSEVGFAGVSQLPRLRQLDLSYCQKLDNDALALLESHPQLEDLDLSYLTAITDMGLKSLASLPQLKRLSLACCARVGDLDLAPLADCPALERLSLIQCHEVKPKALDSLAKIKTLRDLNLEHCRKLQGENMRALTRLPKLRTLNLACTGLNNAGLADLARCPSLEVLDVTGCRQLSSSALDQYYKETEGRVQIKCNVVKFKIPNL